MFSNVKIVMSLFHIFLHKMNISKLLMNEKNINYVKDKTKNTSTYCKNCNHRFCIGTLSFLHEQWQYGHSSQLFGYKLKLQVLHSCGLFLSWTIVMCFPEVHFPTTFVVTKSTSVKNTQLERYRGHDFLLAP